MRYKDLDIEYVSGVIDSVGYLQMTQQKGSIIVKVSVMSADYKFLESLCEFCNVGKIYTKRNIYVWLVQAKGEIKRLLQSVYPHLRQQKERAAGILEFLDTGSVPPNLQIKRKIILKPRTLRYEHDMLVLST